jgi:ribonuclease HII
MTLAPPGAAAASAVSPSRLVPTVDQEEWLWGRGYGRVAGVDEAGRGALAGPLVAAAVVLPQIRDVATELTGLRDSKLLTAPARRAFSARIRELALGVGVAIVPASLLDAAGLAAAGQLALCRAVAALHESPAFLLVDAFRLRATSVPQLALIHGDGRCLSIAAASVIAKVVRDDLMSGLHADYPPYAFDRHKGYGTAEHRAALVAHGPCPEHRRSYAPVRDLCGS